MKTSATAPARKLSAQQTRALEVAITTRQSQIITAVAGSGKTTLLLEIAKNLNPSLTSAFCAFNKAIASEIDEKAKALNLDTKVGTLHSFGYGAIRRAFNRVNVDANKLNKIARSEFTGEYENLREFVISAARMAKEYGIFNDASDNDWYDMLDHHELWDNLPNGVSCEQGIDAAKYLLSRNNELKNVIEFSDMIYFPVLFNLKIWQYDVVFLDEAQDTNNPRRLLVKKMIKNGGKLIAVGDPHQAIYGFTGADSNSLDLIKKEFDAIETPLSVTFRCPKKIVEYAKQWVDHIEADETAPDGSLEHCHIKDLPSMITNEDVIICRNTAPLVTLAYSFIRDGIPCRVEGRSIGEGLIKMVKKWKLKTVGDFETKLNNWGEKEMEKHKKRDASNLMQTLDDKLKTLAVFIDLCEPDDSLDVLVAKINDIFSDTVGSQRLLTLSTIHKAKGKEWDRVFALGVDTYSPSKYAQKEWEMRQEFNLCYVQATRAKDTLVIVTVPQKK